MLCKCRAKIGGMIDVAVLGRVGVDLYPNELRTPLRERSYVHALRRGLCRERRDGARPARSDAAIVSRVGDDPHGDFVRDFL